MNLSEVAKSMKTICRGKFAPCTSSAGTRQSFGSHGVARLQRSVLDVRMNLESVILDNLCRFRDEIRMFARIHRDDFDTDDVQEEFAKILDKWDVVLSAFGVPAKTNLDDQSEHAERSSGQQQTEDFAPF